MAEKFISLLYPSEESRLFHSERENLPNISEDVCRELVIKLNKKVDDELDIYVGNMVKFTALPGTSSEAYAVKVSSIIREEEPV